MKKTLLAFALLLSAGLAMAAGTKAVYSGEALSGATVDKLVARYAAEKKQETPASPDMVLVLVNGSREGFERTEADAKLAGAKTVEVLSSGGSYVVNIVTR